MGRAMKGEGGSEKPRGVLEASGLLTREQFLGLARRCHLDLDATALDMLGAHGFLSAIQAEGQARYAPVHLWLLARYFEAVRTTAHPWDEWPTRRPQGTRASDLKALAHDAVELNHVIAWFSSDRPRDDRSALPASASSLARDLRTWLSARQTLGALREVLPLLRPDMRAGLRGGALMEALLYDLLDRLMPERPLTSPLPSTDRATVQERALSPLQRDLARTPAAENGAPAAPPSADRILSGDGAPGDGAPVVESADPVVERDDPGIGGAHRVDDPAAGGEPVVEVDGLTEGVELGAEGVDPGAEDVDLGSEDIELGVEDIDLDSEDIDLGSEGVDLTKDIDLGSEGVDLADGVELTEGVELADGVELTEGVDRIDEVSNGVDLAYGVELVIEVGAEVSPSMSLDGDPPTLDEVALSEEDHAQTMAGRRSADPPLIPVADDPAGLAQALAGGKLKAPEKIGPAAGFKPAEASAGLRGALARAREAADRRSTSIKAHKGQTRSQTRSTGEIPRVKMPEEHLPLPEAVEAPAEAVVSKGPGKKSKDKGSIEDQVRNLNTLRKKYTAAERWDQLVKLYEEGIDLFSSAADRKGVYLYIGALSEHKLGDADRAAAAYEKALECAPGDWDVFLTLERLYAADERWDALLNLMDGFLEASADEDERLEVMLRRASLLATALNRHDEALEQYRALLAEEPGPESREEILAGVAQLARTDGGSAQTLLSAATLMESFWSVERHGDELIDLYEGMFDVLVEANKSSAAEVMSRLASCYQASDQLRSAFVALVRALSCDPDREDVFIRLESLAERLDGLRELAAIYEDDFESVLGQRHKALLGRRLAGLYEKLRDQEGQRRAWQSVTEADPFDVEPLMRLSDLYQRAGQVVVLLETLDRLRALVKGDDRVRLLLRIARIRAAGQGPDVDGFDLDAAVEALQDALADVDAASPMEEAVIEFVRELIESSTASLAFQMTELLEQHFAQQGNTQAIIDTFGLLIDRLLKAGGNKVEAAGLMLRVGLLHAEQLSQPELAFLYASRALRTDPQSDEALDRVRELAASGDRWEELAALFEEILESEGLANRSLWLERQARLANDDLEDAERAYPSYLALYELQQDHDEALGFLEVYYQERAMWPGLLDIILTRAGEEGAVAERKRLLERAASLSLEELGDVALATDTLRRILTIDPDDAALLERLVVLYRAQGLLEDLSEFLARQEELTRDPNIRADVMLQRVELLQEIDQPAEALEVLTRLRAARPDDIHALRLLESLYTAQGRDLEAYAILKSLYELLDKKGEAGSTLTGELDQLLTRMAAMAETVLGSSDEASIHYQTLLARNPVNIHAIGQLERIYEETQNWNELVSVLRSHALWMIQQGEKIAAVVLYERILEIATEQTDDTALEFEALEKTLELRGEGDLSAYERLAELARRNKRWKLCLWANEGFLARLEDPVDQAAILQEMAQVAEEEMDDRPLATTFLERALDASPDDLPLLNQMADRYRRQARHRSLAQTLRHIIDQGDQLTPDLRVRTCRELSEVLSKHLDDERQAIGLLEQALMIIRSEGDKVSIGIQDSVRRRAIRLYAKVGDQGAALSHLEEMEASLRKRGVSGDPLARVYEDLARIHVQRDQLDEAQRHFLSAIEEDEASVAARLGLAEIHLERSQWSEAASLLEALAESLDALPNARDKGRVLAGLGRLYGATNKAAKAVEAYNAALAADPTNAEARAALA